MCRPDPIPEATAATNRMTGRPKPNRHKKPIRLLLSMDSYEEKHHANGPPGLGSCLLTCIVLLALLTAMEHFVRFLLQYSCQDPHPDRSNILMRIDPTGALYSILQHESNRHILARHLGVDALSCLTCAFLGWTSRHICLPAVLESYTSTKETNNNRIMAPAAYEQRLYTYHPNAFRISLFFFVYQCKNLYDSYVWNDGPEYIFHHIFSMITAWGAMFPGTGLFYTIFFFGLSEISTAILCILANLDNDVGVPGLGDALPTVKILLGSLFVILFVTCRCILWPLFSIPFVQDLRRAAQHTTDPRSRARRHWIRFFMISLTGISILQVAWLGQIVVTAQEELTKAGWL